jgi:hypothetical protein
LCSLVFNHYFWKVLRNLAVKKQPLKTFTTILTFYEPQGTLEKTPYQFPLPMTHRLWHTGTTLLSILLLYGCGSSGFEIKWSSASEPDDGLVVTQVEDNLKSVNEASVAAEEDAPTADELWHRALDSGMSAARLAQTAISPQDWELVSSRWGRAIQTLQAIPEDASNYAEAQAKIEQYNQNQQIAQQYYQKLTADVPATVASAQPGDGSVHPAATVGAQQPVAPAQSQPQRNSTAADTLCRGVTANSAGQPIEISNIRFYRPPVNPYNFGYSAFDAGSEKDYMIGCLTNNSSQPLNAVAMEFSSKMNDGGGFSSGGLDLPVEVIQPGATVPFRGPFGIDPETSEIVVEKLTGTDGAYQPVETVEPKLKLTYSPTPAAASSQAADQLCSGIRPTKNNQAFEVNQLQIYLPPFDPYAFEAEPQNYLVGCITNHSDEPLSDLGMAYSDGEFGGGGATVNVPGDNVPPGATVPFRKFGDVDADQASITVLSFNSNLGEIEVGITVNR